MGDARALWQWNDLVRAAVGVAEGMPADPITGFSLDTRSIKRGEVFVALKDQRDGHEFVEAAFKAGAAAALVSIAYARKTGDGALIRVADTLRGLESIARASRARLDSSARVIAVTGSVGKTGTSAMLRACLQELGATHAPEKSFNNHWGVPLTLARMPATTRFAVIEIGMNHSGEITPLTRLTRPHVALITTVEPVHLASFASVEAIADAKAEIFLGLEPGGTAVLNHDNPHFDRLAAQARAVGARILSFGHNSNSEVRPTGWDIGAEGSDIAVMLGDRTFTYRLAAPGAHLAMNSLGVVATLLAAGADLDAALPALSVFDAPQGRGARMTLTLPAGGTALLIDESYNANPASMRAALATMATLPRTQHPRRIAILGDMLELGEATEDLHRDLKDPIVAAGVDLVLASGPQMRHLFDGLPTGIRGHWEADADSLTASALDAVRSGDVIVIKGSNGARSWRIAEAMKKRFAASAA